MIRFLHLAAGIAIIALSGSVHAATGIEEIWHRTYWGESSEGLLQQFGVAATRLPNAFDFGDSYADVVLPRQLVGGVAMMVFFQMNKATHGLKRI